MVESGRRDKNAYALFGDSVFFRLLSKEWEVD